MDANNKMSLTTRVLLGMIFGIAAGFMLRLFPADGVVHELELEFVDIVAGIFELDDERLERLKSRHIVSKEGDPYLILGADRNWDNKKLKAHHRSVIMKNHPDAMVARGVPPEFLKIANDRLAKINVAWDAICKERGI